MTDWQDILYKICEHLGWTVFESSQELFSGYVCLRIYDKSCPVRAQGCIGGISTIIPANEFESARNEKIRQFVKYTICDTHLVSDCCPSGYPIVPDGDSWEEIRIKMEITNG